MAGSVGIQGGRQPHLARADAQALLLHALDAYRREHHTAPARIVLHKTSAFTDDEAGGFQDAADERFIDTLEMSWITSSEGATAFRPGDVPPLRGTLVTLGERQLSLYTTGSIEFYRTYPGMYIPRPIGIRPSDQDELEPDPPGRTPPRHPAHSQPGQIRSALLPC
jgi:hypothetical protein